MNHWVSLFAAWVIGSTLLQASDADFYLLMNECSTTVGYTVLSDVGGLKTLDGTTMTNACSRTEQRIRCALIFDDGSEGTIAEYRIFMDTPPRLMFTDDTAADWFMIDTSAHAVVMVTRVVGEQFAGAKVCQGVFATREELQALERDK